MYATDVPTNLHCYELARVESVPFPAHATIINLPLTIAIHRQDEQRQPNRHQLGVKYQFSGPSQNSLTSRKQQP
ncbi:hypothetical protein B0H12DRAFT_670888 [Mycena haematopus]|nr:hypothetical protein B0H12DRAFT_670888 [Mycena haematopus]